MRQQFFDTTGRLCRQSLPDVLQVDVGIMAIQLRRLDQTHDGSATLATNPLVELAMQSGYIPADSVTSMSRKRLGSLLRTEPVQAYVYTYAYRPLQHLRIA